MNVLALTHAHLMSGGLSPVSCERADSITGAWGARFGWKVDVVYTSGTAWRGIWPGGKGLTINILEVAAPKELMLEEAKSFSVQIKSLLAQKQFLKTIPLVAGRVAHRLRTAMANKGWVRTRELVHGARWAHVLATDTRIREQKYDFLFACVGYGDEYLLQTALTLSAAKKIPMIVDFRDLWSDHHDPDRFNEQQRNIIRSIEKRLLSRAILISVPHRHMAFLLGKWTKTPVHLLSHSAYVGADWKDGHITADEFRMVYAGKVYATGPGMWMLMELLKKLSVAKFYKPMTCHFYVDDVDGLKAMAETYGVSSIITVNGWVSPQALWGSLRSAHVLLLPDAGVAENYPLLPTKIFQYAYTGRQILCIEKFTNHEIGEFLQLHSAGLATTNIDEAAVWLTRLSEESSQYLTLPPLRNIRLREDQAVIFGQEIEKTIAKKNTFAPNE
jgi:hypothetical protein